MTSSYLPPLEQYQTFLFDCDGVILDSNSIKTDAFARLAAPFGESVQAALIKYHVNNGGVSRFEKVKYLVCELLHHEDNSSLIAELVARYGQIVFDGLLSCGECTGIRRHLDRLRVLPGKIHVVSGGLESELQQLFLARGLDVFFDTINGSPRDKFQLINNSDVKSQLSNFISINNNENFDKELVIL